MTKDADRAGDAASEVPALTGTVDERRSEAGEIAARASETALLERAKGVVMAQEHVSAAQAYDRLLLRARVRGRSLREECWSTLGRTGSDERPRTADTGPEATAQQEPLPFRAARYVSRDRTLLRNLAAGLKAVRTADEAAQVLRAVFAGPMGTDAVMIYARAPEDGLDLLGSAGVDDRIVTQWSHTPPLPGLAPLEALDAGTALWLEHPARDAQRHLLIGGEPERWPSRAWLPVLRTGNGSAPVAIGLFRTVHGEFDAVMRDTLLRAVPPVAAALDDLAEGRAESTAPEDIASVQTMLDALSGPAVLLSAVRSAGGDVEDFRVEAAAPGSVDVAGRQGKELVGRTVLETYPTVAGTPLWEGYLETLATGAVYDGEPFTYRETAGGIPTSPCTRCVRPGWRAASSSPGCDTTPATGRPAASTTCNASGTSDGRTGTWSRTRSRGPSRFTRSSSGIRSSGPWGSTNCPVIWFRRTSRSWAAPSSASW
ncbi:ANTAR domain-containing protein [Streptomyces avidinii]